MASVLCNRVFWLIWLHMMFCIISIPATRRQDVTKKKTRPIFRTYELCNCSSIYGRQTGGLITEWEEMTQILEPMLVLVPAKSNVMTLFESRLWNKAAPFIFGSPWEVIDWTTPCGQRHRQWSTVWSETDTAPVGVIQMVPIGTRVRKHPKDKRNYRSG